MNIDKLSVGLIIKNYKELCTLLDIKVMTSTNSKKAQFKELERYCIYTKQGQKITIVEIFQTPLDKEDLRQEGNNTKYVEHVKELLLHKLSETEGYKYTLTKDRLLNLLGMVNPSYLEKGKFKKMIEKKDERIKNFDINHFYLRANDKLTKILFSSLNSLKNRFLINYREIDIVVRLDINGIEHHTEATEAETLLIMT